MQRSAKPFRLTVKDSYRMSIYKGLSWEAASTDWRARKGQRPTRDAQEQADRQLPSALALQCSRLQPAGPARRSGAHRPHRAPVGKPPPPAEAYALPEQSEPSPEQLEAKLTGVDVRLA